MDLGIKGRVAMVAAASKGIGLAAATALAKEGCKVSICSRDPASLAAAKAKILEEAPEAAVRVFPCDVTNAVQLEAWHRSAAEELGPVDILVTNTGGPPAAQFLDLTEEQWRRGIDLTLMNVVRLSRLVLPGMRQRRWGRLIHLTSLTAKQPIALLTISSTLRAGLSALTKTMSNEFSRDGVLVNAVVPGHVLTARQVELNEIRSKQEGISIEDYASARAADDPDRPLRRAARDRRGGRLPRERARELHHRGDRPGGRRPDPEHVLAFSGSIGTRRRDGVAVDRGDPGEKGRRSGRGPGGACREQLGYLGILPGHAPLISLLKTGVLTYRSSRQREVAGDLRGFRRGGERRRLGPRRPRRRACRRSIPAPPRKTAPAAEEELKTASRETLEEIRTRLELAQARLDVARGKEPGPSEPF